jgi:prepilin-type processing-associated H-X9-DG protein
MNDGGSQEFVQNGYLVNEEFYFAFRQFQVMSNCLGTPKILICPADTRRPASDFGTLKNSKVSFFVGVNADAVRPRSILAGDRNITNSPSQNPSIIPGDAGGLVWWTQELHQFKGNVLFADTHVEEWNNMTFSLGSNGSLATAVLFLPSVKPGVNQLGSGTAGSTPANSAPVYSNPDSSSSSESPSESPPAATMGGQPNPPPDNSLNHQAESETPAPELTQPQNSSGATQNIPAIHVQNGGAAAPINEPASVMSPFDRQVIKFLQAFVGWGYLFLLLLFLLLLLMLKVWRQLRRKMKQKAKRKEV